MLLLVSNRHYWYVRLLYLEKFIIGFTELLIKNLLKLGIYCWINSMISILIHRYDIVIIIHQKLNYEKEGIFFQIQKRLLEINSLSVIFEKYFVSFFLFAYYTWVFKLFLNFKPKLCWKRIDWIESHFGIIYISYVKWYWELWTSHFVQFAD